MRLDKTAIVQQLARWLEAIGQLERAEAFYQSVIARSAVAVCQMRVRVAPQTATPHHHLAQALIQQDRCSEAQAAIRQAIALDSSNPGFHQTLGTIFVALGQGSEAISAFQHAIALDSQTSWFHQDLGKALAVQEQWDAAIAAFQQAIALDPEVSWFHAHLGETLVKANQPQQAIPVLQKATALQPSFFWSYYYLGEAHLALGEIERAIAQYQQALAIRPDHEYLQSSLAYAQHLQTQETRIAAYVQQSVQQKDVQQIASVSKSGDRSLKILMLSPYPAYPPKNGAIARIFHELEALGERHHVVFAGFMFSKEDYQLETDLERYCDLALLVSLGDAPPRLPDQPQLIHRYSSARMEKLLQQLSTIDFDIVACNFIYMAQYRHRFPKAFAILAEHNIESDLLRRCAAVSQSNDVQQLAAQVDAVKAFVNADREADLLAAYENQLWPDFHLRSVVSEADAAIMNDRVSVGETIVVNNGIDLRTVSLLPVVHNNVILFIGTMSYFPNIDGATYFVQEILPLLWQQDPTIQFWIAGSNPPSSITHFAGDPRIRVIANPDDMSDVARQCTLSVVPLRVGSGTRIKIIHSMAMGLPIVSTTLGCEGLAVEDGHHLWVRDTPAEFAAAVLNLLGDRTLWQSFREQGRTLVDQYYNWSSIYRQAEQSYVQSFWSWKKDKEFLDCTPSVEAIV